MTEKLIQSNSVFEITDYTTASDWERFIANLEEVLAEWSLNRQSDKDETYRELPVGAISEGILHEEKELIKLGGTLLEVRYLHLNTTILGSKKELDTSICQEDSEFSDAKDELDDGRSCETSEKLESQHRDEYGEHEISKNLPECLLDLVSTNNDFAPKAHCLVRWYNLRRFIILTLRGDTLISSDKLRLIVSSACMVLASIDCHVPIFVQHHNPKNNLYQGISEHLNIRTNYEMVYYKYPIKQFGYLSELISMFREKTGCNLNDPMTVSIRLNFNLSSFELFDDQFKDNVNFPDEDTDELVKMTSDSSRKDPPADRPRSRIMDLKNDATFEQVVEALKENHPKPYKILRHIHIGSIWPSVSDKVIVDSQVHTDLDPVEAPIWTMRCVTSDNSNLKILNETQAISDLLNSAVDYAYDELDASDVFSDYENKESLKDKCIRLSYELSKQPEVILSEKPGDSLRKLIALLFHRASELTTVNEDQLSAVALHLKKKARLDEVHRNFGRKQKASVKEFIIRSQISRPFQPITSPALPQRMFCTVSDTDFRLCGAFSELCN